MVIVKKIAVLIITIASVFGISVGYQNHLVKEAVKEDLNSGNLTEELVNVEAIQGSLSTEKNSNEDVPKVVMNETEKEGQETNLDNNTENKENKSASSTTKLETISGSYANLKNETCAWGFVRKPNGQRPEFYGPHTKVLDNYEGIYCGNSDHQVIYLTFDEGYENGYTASILDTLKEKNVTAAFFVTMPYVKKNPDLVKRMIDEGHIVGNHTVNHPSMPEVKDDEKLVREVMDLHNYVKENFNYEMSYLRPPKGEYSERTVKLCLDLGYRNVLWSSAYLDWDVNNQKGSDNAKKMIYNNLHNGSVMLLHAVSKDNATVLGEVIDEIRNRGFEFLSLDEFER